MATGVDYAEFDAPGPNEVFVARMTRSEPSVTIDSMIAQGRLIGDRETVSGMVSRYDQTISWWGQEWGARYQVVVGINGSFFDLNTGVPESGQVAGGFYAKRYGEPWGEAGFGWDVNRNARIGKCVYHRPEKNFVEFATSATLEIETINVPRGDNELLIYTNHFDSHTHTDSSGNEVLVALTRPSLLIASPNSVEGQVVAVRPNQGSTPVPFDHLVLSATGSTGADLLANVAVGDVIHLSQEFSTYEYNCSTSLSQDWNKTFAGVGGSFYFLEDGVVQSFTDPGATNRNPRTAVAYNDDYVFFIVVDGRTSISVGMTMAEIGAFCRDTLGATYGINQDGGGSSAIWVDGSIRNNPSDGTERAVANGLMMAVVLPKDVSPTLGPQDTVEAPAGATLRLGPGTNFGEASNVGAGTAGDVLDHEAAGALATGAHWWLVQFGNEQGWVDEAELVRTGGPARDGGLPPSDANVLADAGGSNNNAGSGCSCRTSGPAEGGGALLGLMLMVLGLGLTHHRNRRRNKHAMFESGTRGTPPKPEQRDEEQA